MLETHLNNPEEDGLGTVQGQQQPASLASTPSETGNKQPEGDDMTTRSDIFDIYAQAYDRHKQTVMSIRDYLEGCKKDPSMYASASERMLKAIGEPQLVNTADDQRLGRIYMNRTIKVYPAFKDFYGLEETIERIVGYFRHAAQGLEERKQILYLLGPVGGGKSSLAERLKQLMETQPIYARKYNGEISPVFEFPLSLFDPLIMGVEL